MKPLDEELQEIRSRFVLKINADSHFRNNPNAQDDWWIDTIRQLVEERERCRKCNGIHKCSEHFEKHPCCGSTEYNRHSYTCINND